MFQASILSGGCFSSVLVISTDQPFSCSLLHTSFRCTAHRLPWCAEPLQLETISIIERLSLINRSGFLTINSQPQLNGVDSEDPVFGWGGSGGVVLDVTTADTRRVLDAATSLSKWLTSDAIGE